MSKKHKKKKKHDEESCSLFSELTGKSKKKMNKEFQRALDEIESFRVHIYETDKKSAGRKERKRINREEAGFFTSMDSIRCRKKISKKWEKDGFMDKMTKLLKEISPFVQMLARALASLITLFLSLPAIKKHISPKTLSKISTVFDIAMAM